MRGTVARLLGAAALALAVGGALAPSAAAADDDERSGVLGLFLATPGEGLQVREYVAGASSPVVQFFLANTAE